MQKLLALVIMMVCLFGPMTIFALVGRQALEAVGRRPSEGAAVMIPFLLKLLGATFVSIALLMVLLKFFVPRQDLLPVLQFRDATWKLAK